VAFVRWRNNFVSNATKVDMERDMQQFIEYFENPLFRSDGLKLYPTLVIRGTGLYELWKTGRYKSYSPSMLVDLVAKILALVPPWTRVYRVQRDIPMPLVRYYIIKLKYIYFLLLLFIECVEDTN